MPPVARRAVVPVRGLGEWIVRRPALAWAALEETVDHLPDPIVLVLTGFGLKYGVK